MPFPIMCNGKTLFHEANVCSALNNDDSGRQNRIIKIQHNHISEDKCIYSNYCEQETGKNIC